MCHEFSKVKIRKSGLIFFSITVFLTHSKQIDSMSQIAFPIRQLSSLLDNATVILPDQSDLKSRLALFSAFD
jgi:hypothetical protein